MLAIVTYFVNTVFKKMLPTFVYLTEKLLLSNA